MTTDDTAKRPPKGRHRRGHESFRYRHRVAIRVLAAILVAALTISGAYIAVLNSKLGNFARTKPNTIDETNRPDPHEGEALTLLLLGTDGGDGDVPMPLREAVVAEEWPQAQFRSDTMMMVHIPADRDGVYLISIPRDSYIDIHDETGEFRQQAKANAAFALYGPNGAVSTVEHLSDLRMENLAIIDWDGFRDLTSALGGVEVFIPETFRDPSQGITWEEGWQELRGADALAYVRTRYGLTEGDFGRIKRQQNFIRATMEKLLARGTLTNPVRLNNVLDAVVDTMILSAEWETGDIRALALSLRSVGSEDVSFMTLPSICCRDVPGQGNVVDVDEERAAELFEAIRKDEVQAYIEKYPDEALDSDTDIN